MKAIQAGIYRFVLVLMLMTMFGAVSYAQHSVSGDVTNSQSGETLPGVNILVKGTSQGTTTNLDGHYELTTDSPNDTLVVSYVGFQQQMVPINGRSVVDIGMTPRTLEGEELVVVGYGTMKKEELTSSISSVSDSLFSAGSVSDAGQLIQGKIPGLVVTKPSGDPTSGSQISLRGKTTLFGANSNPLVLIDGVPGNLKTVAPENIKSIDVLKGGSAAAIYGTRGSNGVILITTKQASGTFKNSLEYSTKISVQTIENQLDMLDAADYRRQIDNGMRDPSWDLGSTTDWMDQVTRTPVSQIHNLTYRGGNNKTNYLVNVNYRNEEGLFIKSDNETFKVRAELNQSMFDDKVDLHLGVLSSNNSYISTTDGGSFSGWVYRQAMIRNPTAPVKKDGTWFEQPGIFEYENPVALLKESSGKIQNRNSRINGKITFNPVEHLQLKGLFSYTRDNQTRGYAESKDHISNIKRNLNGYASNGAEEGSGLLSELTAQYTNSFNKHDVTVLGGYSYQENTFREYWLTNYDFPTDAFTYNNIGIGDALRQGKASMYSTKNKTNLIGFFGRVNYDYDNKYLLMGSLRYEAASQLWGTKDPWGLFPAVSAGWRITNEPFMQNQNIFDNLKLRVGYGVTGSQPADLFLGVAKLGYQNYAYYGGNWIRTLTPTQNPNPDLQWEEKREINMGVDFTTLGGRVDGSVDYYIRKIVGLLYDYPVPSPPNIYPRTRANVGEMKNQGIEAQISTTPIQTKNFTWNSSFNFSTNSNELVSISNDKYELSNDYFTTGYTGPPVQTFTHIVEVGHPVGDFYGFKVIGVDDNGKWIYEDADGKAVPFDEFQHTFANKKRLGNGIPNYYAGWNNTFRYKNWDLSISMRGAFDFQIYNLQRMYYENTGRTQYNRMKSAYDKVYGKAVLSQDMPVEYNSYYVEDGDYWKIDNIVLGYNVPVNNLPYINSARVYVSSLNTLTITGYKGIDPEVNQAGLDPGVDNRDKYPTTRTFTFGINLNF